MRKYRRRIFEIISIGNQEDWISRAFDYCLVAAIILNITVLFLETFDSLAGFMWLFETIESITVLFFMIEYGLRIYTAPELYDELSPLKARLRFLISFDGIVDLLTILPFFFLYGFAVFRILRVVRIFHLFRLNSNYDSFNVITSVLYRKRNQLFSSIFILLILLFASSLCMYSAEHEAQPELFQNAFSGIWYSLNTIFTVGYGDIYPITQVGRFMGAVITFLGVGAVAIPTGIISAGFVEEYQRMAERENSIGLRPGSSLRQPKREKPAPADPLANAAGASSNAAGGILSPGASPNAPGGPSAADAAAVFSPAVSGSAAAAFPGEAAVSGNMVSFKSSEDSGAFSSYEEYDFDPRTVQVVRATTLAEQTGAYYVRIEAMARQYKIKAEQEFDRYDGPDTRYIVLKDRDFPVATCRLIPVERRTWLLGRVVVLEAYRGCGLGRRVITEAEAWIRELGGSKCILDARDTAVGFYEKLGYSVDKSRITYGEIFTCIRVEKDL